MAAVEIKSSTKLMPSVIRRMPARLPWVCTRPLSLAAPLRICRRLCTASDAPPRPTPPGVRGGAVYIELSFLLSCASAFVPRPGRLSAGRGGAGRGQY